MRFLILLRNVVAEFLAWLGIVGGCLTLFGSFADVMPLAPWASTLIATWHAYTTEPVLAILSKIGMYSAQLVKSLADPAWFGAKSFAFFTLPLAFGLRLQSCSVARRLAADQHRLAQKPRASAPDLCLHHLCNCRVLRHSSHSDRPPIS
jgi:hypothetical protein